MSALSDYFSERLPELLEVVEASDVYELEIQEGAWQVRLSRAAGAWDQEQSERGALDRDALVDREPERRPIRSPLVGTFYRAGAPGMAPLVGEGTVVEPQTVVGIVEALQVLTEVEAGQSGVIAAALATDGQPVEYGQTLFEVEIHG